MIAQSDVAGNGVLASLEQAMPGKRTTRRQPDIRVYASDAEFGPTDVPLLKDAQASDTDVRDAARRRWFDLYKDACYTFLRKLRLDRGTANELVADVWAKLAEGRLLRTYDLNRKKKFRDYLKQTLRNLEADIHRGRRESLGQLDEQQAAAGTPTPAAQVAEQDQPIYNERGHNLLAEAITRLMAEAMVQDSKPGKSSTTKSDRLKLNLSLAHRMACGEGSPQIAEDTGLTADAVRARARDARRKLEAEMRAILHDRFRERVDAINQEGRNELERKIYQKVDDELTFIMESLGTLLSSDDFVDAEADDEPR